MKQIREFTPLGNISFSGALERLLEAGHITPLAPIPPPNSLPPYYDPSQYCAYHHSHGHLTKKCFRLHHKIKDLIDAGKIAPPSTSKPNIIINPLPNHNLSHSNYTNFIQTDFDNFDPNTLISPATNLEAEPFALSAFISEDMLEWILREMESEENEEETLIQAENEEETPLSILLHISTQYQ